jgi:hypothetical protein
MKKTIAIIATLALVAVTVNVLAGSSGVVNPVKKMTPAGSAHRDRAAEFGDDVVTALDTLTTQNTVLVQGASVTAVGTLETNTFATAFSVAPVVVLTYTEDPGDVRPAFLGAVTTSNFICTVASSKNYSYIAVGTR